MAQHLTVFFNDTDQVLRLWNKEDGRAVMVWQRGIWRSYSYTNIPDNSDSNKYFDGHHIEIYGDQEHIFSFWDDDGWDYRLRYCVKNDWRGGSPEIPGKNNLGNYAEVALVLTEDKGSYALTAHSATTSAFQSPEPYDPHDGW